MGGRVLFALSIAAFPEDFPRDAMATVFEAAASKVREAGGVLAGGHTIRDPEPEVRARRHRRRPPRPAVPEGRREAGRHPAADQAAGDGPPVSGRRSGRTSDDDLAEAIEQMRTLNRAASEVFARHRITGATDVTGFGLLGHGLEMARASDARLVFHAPLAAVAPGGARPRPGGRRDGGRRAQPAIHRARARPRPGVAPELVTIAYDPQTSGGLLAAIDPAVLAAVEADLGAAGVGSWRVGTVETAGPTGPGVSLA